MTPIFYIQFSRYNKRMKRFNTATELHNYIITNRNNLTNSLIIFKNQETGAEVGTLRVKKYIELQTIITTEP